MIAYNKTWLANLLIRKQVNQSFRTGDITLEELKRIEEKYPSGFYSTNIFVRTGLFLLTCMISSFSGGLVSFVLFSSGIFDRTGGWLLFLGLVNYAALEIIVRTKNHFRSGADDALIWIAGGLIVSGLLQYLSLSFTDYDTILWFKVLAGAIFILSLYLLLRFADALMTLVCFLALLFLFASSWYGMGSFGMETMPFAIMIFSGITYYLSWIKSSSVKTVHYHHCLALLQVGSLLTLYIAGNYFVVEQLRHTLYDTETGTGTLPFAPLFWIFTIAIPFIYIGLGIMKKNVILLRTGLILVAAATFTFKNYYHVAPIELTLILAGVILLGISYALIRYLKTQKNGFTYEDLDENHMMDKINVESLLIVETFSGTAPAPTENRLGGGDFGGGGASSGF